MAFVCSYVTELDQAQFAELRDTRVGSLTLQEQLTQGHLLAPKQRTHGSTDDALRLLAHKSQTTTTTIKHNETQTSAPPDENAIFLAEQKIRRERFVVIDCIQIVLLKASPAMGNGGGGLVTIHTVTGEGPSSLSSTECLTD